MAEACDLKSHKCGFDPHRGHAQFGGSSANVKFQLASRNGSGNWDWL